MTETKTSKRTSHAEVVPAAAAPDGTETLGTKVAAVALVGLGVALIEAELIPGMLLGVAAVMMPDVFPKLGRILRPMVKSTVRAGYAIADKTRETMAEAGEQIQDIVAEVRSEGDGENAAGTRSRARAKA